MKKLLAVITLIGALCGNIAYAQQDTLKPKPNKASRPSPPATVSETLNNGTIVTIDFSRPSLKNRTVGKDIAPFGKVWRTGANEPTSFEVSKNVKIEGQNLPAGKYSLYTIPGEQEWTIIINKTWQGWGTAYKQADDVLRVKVKPQTTAQTEEMLTFNISKEGVVSALWGNVKVNFQIN